MTVKEPPLPAPNVPAFTCAPPSTCKVLALRLISPACPFASRPTRLEIKLSLSRLIAPVALISIFPALLLSEPSPLSIPAYSPLPVISKFRALIAILPPLSAVTATPAPLLRETLLLCALLGKLKLRLLPSSFNPTVPLLDNPPNSTRPPKASNPPPSILISPPTNSKLLPSGMRKPTELF